MKKYGWAEEGMKVTIVGNIPFHLKHRKNKNGVIIKIDGAYIYVRPTWCKWYGEFYLGEIKKR